MKYAVSDVHGNRRALDRLLDRTGFDGSRDELYIIGDAIDRGPDGLDILRMAMDRPYVHMCMGNHEEMMLKALRGTPAERARYGAVWASNGGEITGAGLALMQEPVREAVLDFVSGLPDHIDADACGKKYRLVHGTWPGDRHAVLWESPNPILPARDTDGRHLVVGHTPAILFRADRIRYLKRCGDTMTAFHGDGFTAIDCGCGLPPGYRKRALCALRLDDGAEFYAAL